MANKTERHCVICDNAIIPNTKCKSVAVKPKDMEITFYEVAEFVFSEWNFKKHTGNSSQPSSLLLSPRKPMFKENRFLCCGCGLNLKNTYITMKYIQDKLTPNSYVISRFMGSADETSREKVDGANSPLHVDLALPMPKTPIGKKIKNATKTKRGSETFRNQTKLIISKEMETFTKNKTK
jgi:hypothetical protein